MLKYGLAYGLLSSRRRAREMLLPAITIATGAFLVVIVFAMSAGIKKQAAGLGHADEIGHAIVLIAVTVLLVGVVVPGGGAGAAARIRHHVQHRAGRRSALLFSS